MLEVLLRLCVVVVVLLCGCLLKVLLVGAGLVSAP